MLYWLSKKERTWWGNEQDREELTDDTREVFSAQIITNFMCLQSSRNPFKCFFQTETLRIYVCAHFTPLPWPSLLNWIQLGPIVIFQEFWISTEKFWIGLDGTVTTKGSTFRNGGSHIPPTCGLETPGLDRKRTISAGESREDWRWGSFCSRSQQIPAFQPSGLWGPPNSPISFLY